MSAARACFEQWAEGEAQEKERADNHVVAGKIQGATLGPRPPRLARNLRQLDRADGRLARTPVDRGLEFDRLTLAERPQACPLKHCDVHKHIAATAVGSDETVAFARIVELDDAVCHLSPFEKTSRSVHDLMRLARLIGIATD